MCVRLYLACQYSSSCVFDTDEVTRIYIYYIFPILDIFKFVRVTSLVDRYFYNMYIVKSKKLCFPSMLRTIIYFHVYIIFGFPITYRNAAVLCQSECACLHKTVNMVVFYIKHYLKYLPQKEEHSCKCTELSLKRKEGIEG